MEDAASAVTGGVIMKIMFIGATGAGKTSLIQALKQEGMTYKKTQVVEYLDDYIDTPGEYMQQRVFWCSLTTVSHDADLICFVQDSSSEECWFSPGLASKFAKPVIGIVTKTDRPDSNIRRAQNYQSLTGCRKIYNVSAKEDTGVELLMTAFHQAVKGYHLQNQFRYAAGYCD